MEDRHSEHIKCGCCDMVFSRILDMNIHMDKEHFGLGKLNDPAVLREGERWTL